VVLRAALAHAGLSDQVTVESAGTGDWHVGDGADPRAVATLSRHGYDGSLHRAQQFTSAWYDQDPAPDLILALDRSHVRSLHALVTDPEQRDTVRLLRSFDPALADLAESASELDVPDPYYDNSFEDVMRLVQAATPGVVSYVHSVL
jgi:protein-tyrosine phosphatase